ncbi:MAG: hypothetical protein ACTSPB_13750 [Candidatus Thorarchaeota archaeon]
MNKKTIATHVGAIAIGVLLGILLMYPIGTNTTWFVDISETFREKSPHNIVDVWIFNHTTGQWEHWFTTENLVTTIGKRRVRNLLYGNATDPTNATSAISLSNDASPNASWTKLPNEITGSGLARTAGTLSVLNSTAFQVQHTFQATAQVQVQCAGLHWNPTSNSDGNLFAAATFTQVTLNNNDQIQITWKVNLS